MCTVDPHPNFVSFQGVAGLLCSSFATDRQTTYLDLSLNETDVGEGGK